MSEDLISRQAAINACNQSINMFEATDRIKDLPSVTPKQRTGHWIEYRCDMYICSECDHIYTDLSGERYEMNYCPNCGAKMEEQE